MWTMVRGALNQGMKVVKVGRHIMRRRESSESESNLDTMWGKYGVGFVGVRKTAWFLRFRRMDQGI